MNKIKILTEAGKGIGFGHLTRCTAIFEQLLTQGYNVDFEVFLKDISFKDDRFKSNEWLKSPKNELFDGVKVVLIDSYLVSEEWLRSAKDMGIQLVQIDDFNRILYPVDLIINPNVFADDLDYSNQNALCIGGADYVIIRAPFRNATIKAVEKNPPTLLITIGGSDYRNLLPKLTKWAMKTNLYNVRVVSPGDSLHDIECKVVLQYLNAEEMANEINNADVVISACGQTLHELSSLRKPTIGVCLDDDQVPNHTYYNRVGFLEGNLLWDQVDLESKISNELVRLTSYDERLKIVNKESIINPYGVEKVTEKIIELI
jgi:spore coat polysaccharide biosynthesis predicted glycosyltransferase SpsG